MSIGKYLQMIRNGGKLNMNYNNGHNVMGKEHMKIDLFSILYRGGIYLS